MMLLVFDIDGTLTMNNNTATEAFRKSVYDIFNVSNYTEDWNEYQNDSDTGIISEIVSDYYHRMVSEQELINFQKYYLLCFNRLLNGAGEKVLPVEGVVEFFKRISNYDDVKVALFTGGFPAVAKKKLDLISIDKNFLFSAAFDGLSREKIFLNCISTAEKRYKSKFDKVILFGDSMSDVKISSKFNVPFIGVTTQVPSETFVSAGAKATIQNYRNVNIEEVINYGNC